MQIHQNFVGGNITVKAIEGSTVTLENQIRDTVGDWCYWAFCVEGAEGQTLTFKMQPDRLGYFGPAVSHDLYHWAWSNTAENNYADFTYHFGEDEDCVYFAHNLLYHPSRFHRLCERLGVSVNIPVIDRMGTPIPAAVLGDGANNILLTARHHCCEATGDYIMEGILEEFSANPIPGCRITAVPFVDADGVVHGDQGKNRRPHDHNRDYSEFIYPETKAITEWIAKHANGKLDMFIDVHCPWIRGKYNEWVYTPWKDPKILPDVASEKRFSELLEKLQCGTMRYRAADDLPFGKEWNKGVNYAQGWSAVIWACHKVKGLKIARSYEVPFANANGAVVTPESCRDLGRDTAKVFKEMLGILKD
jgi:hypothetical protein